LKIPPEKNNDALNLKAIEKIKAKFPNLDTFDLKLNLDIETEIHHVMRAFTNYILDHQRNSEVLNGSVELINELVEENDVGETNPIIDVLELETFHVLCSYDQLAYYYMNVLSPQAKQLFRHCHYMYSKHYLGYDI